jgi:hypothetical protein
MKKFPHNLDEKTDKCSNTCGQKITQKEAEKKIKYKSLCIRIQSMWNMKCEIEPPEYNKRFKETLESLTRNTFNRFSTKTAMLGTSHIIRKVLQCET